AFALQVISFCCDLPRKTELDVIRRQLIRSATSVGANYRAACRARSRREFLSKLSIVEEEADESLYWLELLAELSRGKNDRLSALQKESSELAAIVIASKKTARKGLAQTK
ncbi:MAG TPA: four helix bundle protein, partial [Acidobacteriota bacterium]|nr:four helix bundle protein [Acidobacteriota bacterium]